MTAGYHRLVIQWGVRRVIGRDRIRRPEANLIELNDKIESALSDSEAARNSAVSKLRGMLDAATQSLESRWRIHRWRFMPGRWCHARVWLFLERGAEAEVPNRRIRARVTREANLQSRTVRSFSQGRETSPVISQATRIKGEETDQENDKRKSSVDTVETRSASSLSKVLCQEENLWLHSHPGFRSV